MSAVTFPADFCRGGFKAKDTQQREKLGMWLYFHYWQHLGITDSLNTGFKVIAVVKFRLFYRPGARGEHDYAALLTD